MSSHKHPREELGDQGVEVSSPKLKQQHSAGQHHASAAPAGHDVTNGGGDESKAPVVSVPVRALVDSSDLQANIIFSRPALEIVTQPFLVDVKLQTAAEAASCDFIRYLRQTYPDLRKPVVALDILRGGKFYCMSRAWKRVSESLGLSDTEIPTAEVRATRLQNAQGAWVCTVQSPDEYTTHLLRSAGTILIGDTVATGATLQYVIDWILQSRTTDTADSATHAPCDIHIFTIAGGHVALHRLAPVANAWLEKQHGKLHLTFANAVFKLADNGTDLGFAGAEFVPEAEKFCQALLSEFVPHMKCAVWDWGERFSFPLVHLREVKHHFAALPNVPDWITEGIQRAKEEYANKPVSATAAE